MRPSAAIGTAAALLVFSGCGSSSKSPSNGIASKSADQIVQEAQAAALGAKSVHLSGTMKTEGPIIRLDVQLLMGKEASGRMSIDGPLFRLIRIGSSVYVRGPEAFYKRIADREDAKLLKGKWLKVAPATRRNLVSFDSFIYVLTDMSKVVSGLSSHGKLAKGKIATVAGQKVIAITDTPTRSAVYIATTGEPYPIESNRVSSGGAIKFDHWNESVKISAPANAIDISKLK